MTVELVCEKRIKTRMYPADPINNLLLNKIKNDVGHLSVLLFICLCFDTATTNGLARAIIITRFALPNLNKLMVHMQL